MVEKPSSHPWTAAPWLPWALGLALFTIVGSHLVAWFNSTSMAGMIRTQQELFVGLTEYQEMLSDLDESTRAIMLAPERSELRRKKADAVEALQHQLGVLAEKAPIRGPIPKALIGLATHFRKKLVPQADQVQKHAAAPGPFAMDRFRTEYAEVRLQHAERVGELLDETRKLAEQSVSSGQHRLLLSAGLLLLLWSGAMAWLVGQARLRPQALHSALAVHAPSSVEHAAHPSPGPHAASHTDPRIPSTAPGDHGEIDPDLTPALAPEDHTPSAPSSAAASLSDPTAPPPREPDPTPAPAPVPASAVAPALAAPPEPPSPVTSGEMSQSQIADLLQQPQAEDSAPASSPSASPSAVTPLATATAPAVAATAPTPTPTPTLTPAPAPVAAAPAVLPPGPVDLASLMGEVVEEPAVSPSRVSEPSVGPAASVQPSAAPVPPASNATASSTVAVEVAAVPPAPVPAPAVPAPAVPQAPPQPAPQPAVAAAAVVPAPLPDVQTLMKGASAMTTEQLTAMLFGVAPASSAPAPAKAAPAAAPAAPPRTITGAEMATLKPGDDTPPVVDLSF